MRRTYRSKKDTGGALDHRDVLQSMDVKSSAFDAFYIQNLKQTKRELSCVGSSQPNGVASKKVRKRKYVKRIVKEVENLPQRESKSSTSAYLTPDKSLRVNRILDPFDVLLNSSTNGQATAQKNEKHEFETILPKKEGKKYTKKKLKKFNYSSSSYSSQSDKENESDSLSNVTDIRTHHLLIEQEPSNSPKDIDESINKIVNNLTLINNFKGKMGNGSFNTSYKHRNRLMKNCHSPILQKSPLCSTPFKEKYRGKSIYNFSPISTNKQSLNYVTITEENNESNDSIVFLCKQKVPKLSKEITPLANIPMECVTDKASGSLIYEDDIMGNDEVINASPIDNVENEPKTQAASIDSAMNVQSLLQITDTEPFLGFSGDKITDSQQNLLLKCIEEHNSDIDINEIDDSNRSNINVEDNVSSKNNSSCDSNNASLNSQASDKESMYDTCNSEQSDSENENIKPICSKRVKDSLMEYHETSYSNSDNNKSRQLRVAVERMSDSLVKKYHTISSSDSQISIKNKESKVAFEKMSNTLTMKYCKKDAQKDSNNRRESKIAFERMSDTLAMKYLINDNAVQENFNSKEPKVAIERMNDSLFVKYYDKIETNQESSSSDSITVSQVDSEDTQSDFETTISEYEYQRDEEANKSTDSDTSASFHNCSQHNMSVASKNKESDSVDQQNEIIITDSSTTEDVLSSDDEESNCEEERCVSFVTTRRRNEITNDSMFILDNSNSSIDCDKTVLSNKASLPKKSILELDISIEKAEISVINEIDCGVIQKEDNTDHEHSKITTRKSSRLPRASFVETQMDSSINEVTIIETNDDDVKMKENEESPNKELVQKQDRFLEPGQSSIKTSKLPRSSNVDTEFDSNTNEVTIIEAKADNIEIKELKSSNKDLAQKPESYSKSMRSSMTTRASAIMNRDSMFSVMSPKIEEARIVLQPGKKWERSLSIYKRMTTMADHFDQSLVEDEGQKKGRKYRQSIITTMEMQDSLHNESINSRRSTFISKPSRSTIRLVKDSNSSRRSLNSTVVFDDLKGFLSEECDDTVIELSKLSLADSEFEVTVLDVQDTSDRIATAREYVLRRCNQTEPILFDECYPETALKNCHKIGEGVYGEVFLWRARDGRARVMKIVPIAGTVKVNGEEQKDFHEVISEIVIAMELSALRAPIADIDRFFDEGKDGASLDLHAVDNATDVFNEVLAVRCVQGPYPSRLLDLWELYDECKGSENDNPAALPADQQYIVLELANAGQDLESYQFTGAQQAHALFQQIAFGLAVGEESFQFEHRDLHWGNVLIAPTEQKHATFVLRGRTYRVSRAGVAATIIDYSLSRISLPLLGERASLYNDLAADEQLFDAQGDYQFQVYRLMRHRLGNDWKNFEPYTNILWLHYTVDKMITALRYKRTNTKIHKHYIEKLKKIRDTILEFKSATDYVTSGIEI